MIIGVGELSNGYLLDLAIILLFTKIFGLITRKFNLPQVVGALIAGIIMGPSVFNIVQETDFISKVSELGVIVIMFNAGIQSNIDDLKSAGKDLVIIASLGVLIPLVGGFLVACIFNGPTTNLKILENIFVGAVLTATSVSISVETLKEMGKIKTKVANAIIGAAIVDDILGILVLTIITSLTSGLSNIFIVIFKIIVFFIVSFFLGIAVSRLYRRWIRKYNMDKRRFVIAAFVLCLLMSFCADKFFGVADITGAYLAGLILSRNDETTYISRRFEILSYVLLTPIFFANIGIDMKIPILNSDIVGLTIVIALTAVFTKIIGCGLGAKVCKYSNKEILEIGVGMIPRGEVALVIVSKGMSMGVMNDIFVTPLIIMVIFCSITAPILLKISFREKKNTINSITT